MIAQTELVKVGIDMDVVILPNDIEAVVTSVHSKCAETLWTSKIVLPSNVQFDCAWVSNCKRLIHLSVETFRAVKNVQQLPTNIYQLILDGRPSLSSNGRRWIANNMKNLQLLRLNMISHPLLWAEEVETEMVSDLKMFLHLSTLKEFGLSTYSFYNYSQLISLSRQLGFSYVAHRNYEQQYIFVFSRDDP